MNASSSSLPTGWITFWIALGVAALVIFVALPLVITQRAQKEFMRYQACAAKTQTTNCEPSLAWQLNGWSLETVTSTPPVTTVSSTQSVQ